MNKSRCYQSNQEYSLGLATANLNIYNGRLLYNYPLMSIGNGNYQISVGLVYDSHYKETDYNGKKLGFAKGWKFDFEQFLFQYSNNYNLDGFNLPDYVYIDSNWNIHRFVRYKKSVGYKDGECAYYDDSGTGLRLVIKSGTYKIYDDQENTYVFENGKLVRVFSGVNASIVKEIKYEENKVSVYDARKSPKKIKIEYNTDLLPVIVSNTENKINYTFEYDNKKLLRINKKTINNLTKEVHSFRYNSDDTISYSINSEDLTALKFDYYNNSSIPKVLKVSIGAFKKEAETETETVEAEVYVGDDVYVGENKYVTNTSKKVTGYTLSMPDKYITSSDTFNYQTGYTELTSEKGISLRYYFDIEGRVISTLENVDNVKHYTLNRQTGWPLASEGTSEIKFNGESVNVLSKNANNQCVYNFNVNNVNQDNNKLWTDFKDIFIDDNKKASEHFKLTFWIMFKNDNVSSKLANFTYTLNGVLETESVRIEKTPVNSWQQVSIYLNLGTFQTTFTPINISFDVPDAGDNEEILLADVRINEGSIPEICIDSNTNQENHMVLKMGTTIYFWEVDCGDFGISGQKSQTLSPDFYMTEKDIIATYRSLFYRIENQGSNSYPYFDLIYCNKTKAKSVHYVTLVSELNQEYRFNFNPESDSSNIKIPNYHFRLIDLVAFNEESKTWMVNEVQRSFGLDNVLNKYTCKTKNAIAYAEELKDGEAINFNKRLDDNNSTISYTTEFLDGRQIEQVYTKKVNIGSTNVKTIKIISENIYDTFGNLECTRMYNDENNEVIQRTYIYDNANDLNRENLCQIRKNGSTVEYEYYPDGNLKHVITKYDKTYDLNNDGSENISSMDVTLKNKVSYVYDEYLELKEIKFYDRNFNDSNNNPISINELGLNKNGNINLLKDSSGVNHGFIYNGLSKLDSLYRNKKLVERYKRTSENNDDIYKTYLYQGANTYLHSSTYNKYGKTVSIDYSKVSNDGNSNLISFEYNSESTNNKCSSSLERVSKITDGFTNDETGFIYDDEKNEITESNYNTVNGKTVYKKVIKTKPNGAKIYDITSDEEVIKHSVTKEDQMNGNPKSSYCYKAIKSNNNPVAEEDFEGIKYYCYDYEYDSLGRLFKKKRAYDVHTNGAIRVSKDIGYYTNTNFPKEINYVVQPFIGETPEEPAILKYKNSYMDGKITKVKEEGNRYISNPQSADSLSKENFNVRVTNYEYDDINRLIKEIRPNNDIYTYTYGITSNMIEEVKKNGNTIKTFNYESGKLTRFTENGKITNVEYDNYGNITKTDEGIITYNSRNLMDSYEKLNSDKYNYYYNYQGIRFKKQKINGNTINYILDGSRILGEDEVNPNGDIVRKFRYFYDAIGVCGIDYIVNNEHHYFNLIKDSLGNISKVMNHGKYVGEYTYDAWGNCEVSTSFSNDDNDIYVVNHNPFRYKGYYYDEETGLFYCNSRYYNPKWGRWLSPDSIIYLNPRSINGLNLYAYCFNDPINYFDNLGKYPQSNNYNSIWKWRNKDGSWSLYDNDRFEDETPFHEQFFVLNGQLINYNLKDNVHGIGITSFDLITGGWEWDYLDLSLLDFGHAELGLEISKTEGLKVSAMASIYSPSISFKLFGLTFEISFEIGAIGAEAELFSKEGFKLKAAGGLGLGLSIDW